MLHPNDRPMFDPRWDDEHERRQWGSTPDPRVVDFMSCFYSDAAARRNVHVIDLGCGAGANAFWLAEAGFQVDAIDGSRSAISRCMYRKRVDKVPFERLNFSIGDIGSMRYSAGYFDFALDVGCLVCMDWDDGQTALREVMRVLKPGGFLLSFTARDTYDFESHAHWGYMRTMDREETGKFYRLDGNPVWYTETTARNSKGQIDWWLVFTMKFYGASGLDEIIATMNTMAKVKGGYLQPEVE